MKTRNEYRFHETADVHENANVGKGTTIWNNAQVRENTQIGENCIIGKNVYIDAGVVIGNNVKIQNNVSVYNGVVIEDDVFVGPSVVFTNDLYPRAHIWNAEKIEKTLVKKGVSIGANSTIVCGDRVIGAYAMIGAGSVVIRDVEEYSLVVGNPAKPIGYVTKDGERVDKKPSD